MDVNNNDVEEVCWCSVRSQAQARMSTAFSQPDDQWSASCLFAFVVATMKSGISDAFQIEVPVPFLVINAVTIRVC